MANTAQPFRQHHITRALKAASAAGMQDPTVTVTLLPTGATITVGSGNPDGTPSTGKAAKPSVRSWEAVRPSKRGSRK